MKNNKILWADDFTNFWTGCSKVSSGCQNCYAINMKIKGGEDPIELKRTNDKLFIKAWKYNDPFSLISGSERIIVNSISDFFIHDYDIDQAREEAWTLMNQLSDLTFMILTKRSKNIKHCLPLFNAGIVLNNVWLGVSIESQEFLYRITDLAQIDCSLRFVAFEPLLGPIDLSNLEGLNTIEWAIIGGETGTGSRLCEIDWIESLVDQLQSNGIKVFVNNLGTYQSKKLALKDWKGEDIAEWPLSLDRIKIRQIP